jgi:hypothetical protein
MSVVKKSKLVPESKIVPPEPEVSFNSKGAVGMLTAAPLTLIPVMLTM